MIARRLIVLAPARPLSGELAEAIAALLVKADHRVTADDGDRGLYGDLFVIGSGWPAAALTRQYDVGDAAGHAWLRADPAHFRAEPGSVRLMACGDLGQGGDEVDSVLATLCPLFGDEGFELSAPTPARWYLRPFTGSVMPDLPQLPAPEQALGGDLFELWPEDDLHRRWRRIFSEAQILLAQHPVNQRRAAAGRPAINGLWFWGAGVLPTAGAAAVGAVFSPDPVLAALATNAGLAMLERPDRIADIVADATDAAVLLDLRDPRSASGHVDWLLQRWQSGAFALVDWRTPTGRWQWRRRHRWRFWRKPPTG